MTSRRNRGESCRELIICNLFRLHLLRLRRNCAHSTRWATTLRTQQRMALIGRYRSELVERILLSGRGPDIEPRRDHKVCVAGFVNQVSDFSPDANPNGLFVVAPAVKAEHYPADETTSATIRDTTQTVGSLGALYQVGGSRSIQLALKFLF